jgi:hypothetical protein
MRELFTVEERGRVRDRLVEMARADDRIVAGAEIGALAKGAGDRWSDLDLTFGLADGASVEEVLADWTAALAHELDAVHLFDLPVPPTVYRVFLLPRNLQIDLSFTPGTEFIGRGMQHTVLFGDVRERDRAAPQSAEDLFGWAVHHAVRARFCIERGRRWHAEYWIGQLRDHALMLACRRRELEPSYGRGFDDLLPEVLEAATDALVRSIDRDELLRALSEGVELLLGEADEVRELAAKLEPQLRDLTAS